MRLLSPVIPCALLVTLAVPSVHSVGTVQQSKLKVHISVDMEGIAGVVTSEQLGPQGFEYGRFREFMTREALAARRGAEIRRRNPVRFALSPFRAVAMRRRPRGPIRDEARASGTGGDAASPPLAIFPEIREARPGRSLLSCTTCAGDGPAVRTDPFRRG